MFVLLPLRGAFAWHLRGGGVLDYTGEINIDSPTEAATNTGVYLGHTTDARIYCSISTNATTVTTGANIVLTFSSYLTQGILSQSELNEYDNEFVMAYTADVSVAFGGKTYSISVSNSIVSMDGGDMSTVTENATLSTTGLTGSQTISVTVRFHVDYWTTPMGTGGYDKNASLSTTVTVNPATATIKRGTLTNVSSIYYGTSSSSQTTLLSSTSGISLTAGTYYFRYVLSSATGYTYTFSSWSGSLSGTGSPKSLTITAGNTYTIGASATRLANTYNLSYVLNNGTHGTYHPTTATYDTAFQLSNPTRSGYTFAGWTFNGNTSYAKYGSTSSTTSSWTSTSTKVTSQYFKNLTTTNGGTVTLTANWTANTYTVTLNTNKGSGSTTPTAGTSSVTATYGSNMPTSGVTMPTRVGYTFQGFYDTSATTGGTQYYTSTGASARVWNKASATTLYARWTPNTYTITLNPNGGSGGSTSTTATYDNAMPAITPPSRSGWKFLGYYDAQTGGTQYYTNTGASARAWNKASNSTLYAHWQEKTWTEGYYANSYGGGNGTQSDPYIISTAAHLARVAYATNNNIQTTSGRYDRQAYYKQTADIDIKAHLWEPIGTTQSYLFEGAYNGNLYKINNIRVDTSLPDGGLFGYVLNGKINNIHIQTGKIKAVGSCGGVVGYGNNTTIEKCVVEGVTIEGAFVGGIIGYTDRESVINCTVKESTIIGESAYGIARGYAVSNSNAIDVTVTGTSEAGICSNGTNISSYGSGTVNGTATKVMYGDATAWGNWSLVEGVNGGLPIQGGLNHIGGFTPSQEIYDYLTGQGFKLLN